MPVATFGDSRFIPEEGRVQLTWTADNANYRDGQWAIYRNDQFITTVPRNTYGYTDDGFTYESNPTYCIYFVAPGWDDGAKASELKSDELTINTNRSFSVVNLNVACEDDRIIFTWESSAAKVPLIYGYEYKIYVDDETSPIYTVSATEQNIRWEHRTTDQHTDRQSFTKDGIPYTEEPLNGCSPHTYRIDATIEDKVISSVTAANKSIGKGTEFYSIDATKGVYPGTVKLQWHVNLSGSTDAKTYIVDRRRAQKTGESWTTLARMSSTDEYLIYNDDTPLPGVLYDYRVKVEDKCPDGKIKSSEATDIGFAKTTGTISGRITFGASGSSVANVNVEARRIGTSSDDAEPYHSLYFFEDKDAVTWLYPTETYFKDKLGSGDFTVQLWVRPEAYPPAESGHDLYYSTRNANLVCLYNSPCRLYMNSDGQLCFSYSESTSGGTTLTFTDAVPPIGKFTVMPSAPIGRSEVTVYLTGNDNIDVPLTISLNVTGDKPEWTVNPHDFEKSMNVIGKLFVDGVESEDPDDFVAAFIGEECRGVANLEYSARYDGYYVTMDIYGNSGDADKAVTFRAYDASTGTLFPVVQPTENIAFVPLALKGTYGSPTELRTANYIEQQTELKKGWNWISIFVNADDMTPQGVFAKIADDVQQVKYQGVFAQNGSEGIQGSLEALDNYKMYAVLTDNDCTLRLVGTRPTGEVSLFEGWNWMGYGQKLASVDDALAGMQAVDGDIVKGQKGVAYFDEYAWSGSLLTLLPGQGYQVNSSKDISFRFPSAVTGTAESRMAAASEESPARSSAFNPVSYRLYPDNMTITAKVVMGSRTLTDAEIGVFAGKQCRTAAFTGSNGLAYIAVPGDEPCPLTLKVAVDGRVYEAYETLDFTVDAIHGSYDNPFVIDLNTTAISDMERLPLTNDYPVYDLQGRKVAVGKAGRKLNKGVYVKNGKKEVMK